MYWLSKQELESVDEIRAFLLIEHLPSPGVFFHVAHRALKLGGKLTIKTDNAEWLFFYLPVLNMLGFGAHSSDKYRTVLDRTDWMRHPETTHFCIFTKRHLRNYAQYYGFKVLVIKRVCLGARLYAEFEKA